MSPVVSRGRAAAALLLRVRPLRDGAALADGNCPALGPLPSAAKPSAMAVILRLLTQLTSEWDCDCLNVVLHRLKSQLRRPCHEAAVVRRTVVHVGNPPVGGIHDQACKAQRRGLLLPLLLQELCRHRRCCRCAAGT